MRCNRNKLAQVLGRDVKTIDRMVGKGMPYRCRPGEVRGKGWEFDTGDILRWMSGEHLNDQLRAAQTRIAVAKAGLKEIEAAERRGLLVSVHDAVALIEKGDAVVKSRIRGIPNRVAQSISGSSDTVEIERILMREIQSALSPLDKPWSERG